MDMLVSVLQGGSKDSRLLYTLNTVGGALGLIVHGPFRIATEKTIFATPEVSLGAFLNSGSSFYLSRLDGEIGAYLALTGHRLEGIDAL